MIFLLLCTFFPATTMLMLSTLSPFHLGKKIVSFIDGQKVPWWPASKTSAKHLLPAIQRFFEAKIKRENGPLKMMFSHEKSLNSTHSTKTVQDYLYPRISLYSKPQPEKGVIIKALDYDPRIIIKILRNNKYRFPLKNIFIAYVPTNKTVYLGKQRFELLKLCNGKRTIQEIAKQIAPEKEKPNKTVSRSLLKIFKSLQKAGITKFN